jgi:hypothetical protein
LPCARRRHRHQTLDSRQTLLQPHQVLRRQPPSATFDDARTALNYAKAHHVVLDGHGDIVQQPQQPQADRCIVCGIGANLLDRRVEQSVQVDPGQHDAQDVRRFV